VEAHEFIRLQLTVQYDGSAYHGWQVQPDQRTVQGELEAAVSRLANRPRTVLGSGRTDTGVHATGQVASVDMPVGWTPEKLSRSLNALLPDAIWVSSVSEAAPDFHPRYDAIARTYRYRVGLESAAQAPFVRRWCWPLIETIDHDALAAASQPLIGRHSFEAFAKAGQPERGYICTVSRAVWSPWDLGVQLDITADRYLHHMVRYLVGTMMDVARGRRPLADVSQLLTGTTDMTTSPPAPPEGLFLARVEYPAHRAERDLPQAPTPRSTAPE